MPGLPIIYWEQDPALFSLGPLSPRWYGLLFMLGFLFGYVFMTRVFRREGKPPEDLGQLLTCLLAATVIGARLGHCLFYDPAYYLRYPLEIFMIWRGGLASHGGAIGIAIGLYIYTRTRPDQPYLWLLDRIVVPTALAGAFIRVGNFFNSEIIGKPTQAGWGIVFARVDNLPRHPAQLYEAVAYLSIFVMLFVLYRRFGSSLPRGLMLGLFLTAIFSARFAIEFVKVRQAAYEEGFPLSVGQLLSIPTVLIGVAVLVKALHRGRQAPLA